MPKESACSISVGVTHPGVMDISLSMHQRTTSSLNPGDTINCAPASTAAFAISTLSTVPAPIKIFGNALLILAIEGSAACVLSVISIIGKPPSIKACAVANASFSSSITTTGTSPINPIFFVTSFMFFYLTIVIYLYGFSVSYIMPCG